MGKILTQKDVLDPLLELYESGGGNTYYLGFNALARLYSIKEGGCTDWVGYGGSGKSALLLECLKNTSEWYGHKHLIYMPDAGSNEEVIGQILHKMSGKQFDKFYYNKEGLKVEIKNRLSKEEIVKLLPTVLEYFKVYVPTSKAGKSDSRSKAVTPKEFWQFCVDNKKELGLFSGVIDSWNYMRHDTEGFSREDKWLEDTLSFRNELAESSKLHFHTIIHPKSAKKNKDGKIIMPDYHEMKGGSEWGNNGKTIIIVHREFSSTTAEIKVDKAKPKIVGVRGTTTLEYDVDKGAYFEYVGDGNSGRKKYAEKKEVSNVEIDYKPVTTINENFENEKQGEDIADDLPF